MREPLWRSTISLLIHKPKPAPLLPLVIGDTRCVQQSLDLLIAPPPRNWRSRIMGVALRRELWNDRRGRGTYPACTVENGELLPNDQRLYKYVQAELDGFAALGTLIAEMLPLKEQAAPSL